MELWIHVDMKCLAPTPDALARDIAEWAAQGATGVVFEWENMFPYPGFEDAVRRDAYTPAEVGRILGCCKEHGLKAVPLVQTFGHVEWCLSQARYAGLREFADEPKQIRACDGKSWDVLRAWVAALIEAHADCPYIHLGADEAWKLRDVDRPECSAKREGASAVFLRHMKPLFDQVLAAGKRPIIWADMVLRHPEQMGDFPKEVVFCDWLYSQTSEYDAAVHGWDLGRIAADTYEALPARAKELFGRYWRMDAQDFPARFYQFPYLPFLRDRGFDVIAGPSTLYAGNSFAGTNLPRARANQRGWLNAAQRFGGLGALNTCWAVRGALREGTRTGHRAFLFMGRQAADMPGDREVSEACWRPSAGAAAARVAEAVDGLAPCVDPFSRTAPLSFDAVTRTHRPVGYDQRLATFGEAMSKIEDGNPEVEAHQAAQERAARAEAALAPLAESSDEARAWLLGAREAGLRAELWLAVRRKARGQSTSADLDRLAERFRKQAAAVAEFMTGRYRPAEVHVVREDRYESTLRLIGLLKG